MDIRNIAIIAHVDHGKTTLVDKLLRQTGAFRSNQKLVECVMDSNDIERERGITILAKNTAVVYKDTKINIIDTPGHADFGGEVERVLKMADGVLLLVDAAEGPKPQTKFVLRKALGYNLQPLVVINKVDKADARAHEVLDEIFDLFIELGANDQQLDFPTLYASGRDGYAKREMADPPVDLIPLFDAILAKIPPPQVDAAGPLQVLVSNIDYNDYVGRIAIGRVFRGAIACGQAIAVVRADGRVEAARVEQLYVFENLKRVEATRAEAGEIIAMAGVPDININDTITAPEAPEAVPPVAVDEPTISMIFSINDSPLAGRSGRFLTSRHLRDRLTRELRSNLALRVEEIGLIEALKVSGRGLLHLGILIENMRREGFELQVGKPQVIFKDSPEGRLEPIEYVTVDVPEAMSGKVIELIGARRGTMASMQNHEGNIHFEFYAPSRGLIGLRSKMLSATRGEAVMYHSFYEYQAHKGEIPTRRSGVQISMNSGTATNYALKDLEDRGQFFVSPGDDVYEGMMVGEHCKDRDIVVNVTRRKALNNFRTSTSENMVVLAAPRIFSLEEALEYVGDDEWVEVTPSHIRLRKKLLGEKDRKRQERALEDAEEEAAKA
ncbi:MAG: translational GTPase TypA [Planctomycetes bacterium]|nr:translational GTPase TypA [Planctomycetota bacterium]